MANRIAKRTWMLAVLVLTGASAPLAANPGHEFLQRRNRLSPEDISGRMDLGRWAERHDLDLLAADLYHEVIALEDDHEEAFDRWARIADRTRLPEDEQRQAELRERFAGMKLHVTDHFLILYDTDERWARNRAALLEKAHHVYYNTFRRTGFRPLPLRQRLVCVLFNAHEAYLEYAEQVDRVDMGWASGYYSTRTNRIVFFDDRKSPVFQQIVQQVEALQEQVEALRQRIREARAARNHALVAEYRNRLEVAMQELRWYRNRHESLAKLGNAAKTVHEAVHQLAFNSNLQTAGRVYPFWLSEGLATNFETHNPAARFGPLHGNDPRKRRLQQHFNKAGEFIPLEELVTASRARAEDEQYVSLMYDQAWAMFGYLFRYERQALQEYMKRLADLPPGSRTEDELLDEFREAFGDDLDGLQARIRRYVEKLP